MTEKTVSEQNISFLGLERNPMGWNNAYTCILACPLREDCKKNVDLHLEIVQGIRENLFSGYLDNDIDAQENAIENLRVEHKNPTLSQNLCLMDYHYKERNE